MTAVEILFNKLWELPKDKLTWHAVLKETKDIEIYDDDTNNKKYIEQIQLIDSKINLYKEIS